MNRQILMAVCAVSIFAGCGVSTGAVSVDDVNDDAVQDGSELSTTSSSYVLARKDQRKCTYPMCGGWWVKDLNRPNGAEKYVLDLDFTRSGLDQTAQDQAIYLEVVLRGRLATSSVRGYQNFRVYDAYRGLPGKTPAAGSSFYKVANANVQCVRAPCPSLNATKVNIGTSRYFMAVDLANASVGQLDQNWLNDRVENHGALVAGIFTTVNGTFGPETILDASNVYLHIPELPGPCPLFKLRACNPGYVQGYTRDVNRCIVPTGCTIAPRCAQIRPGCATDYTAVTWSGPCPQWACDPTFTLPAAP